MRVDVAEKRKELYMQFFRVAHEVISHGGGEC
jgi:hypothetical protein